MVRMLPARDLVVDSSSPWGSVILQTPPLKIPLATHSSSLHPTSFPHLLFIFFALIPVATGSLPRDPSLTITHHVRGFSTGFPKTPTKSHSSQDLGLKYVRLPWALPAEISGSFLPPLSLDEAPSQDCALRTEEVIVIAQWQLMSFQCVSIPWSPCALSPWHDGDLASCVRQG